MITPTHATDNKLDKKEVIKPRWFEIEVILFKQLNDKKQLKEKFPEYATLPKPSKFFDLLKSYLNPDISLLKHHLLSCDATVAEQALFTDPSLRIQNKPLFILQSLDALFRISQQKIEDEKSDDSTSEETLNAEHLSNKYYTIDYGDDENDETPNKENINNSIKTDSTLSTAIEDKFHIQNTLTSLSDEEITLVKAAELYFSEKTNYTRYPSFDVNETDTPSTCVIPNSYFEGVLSKEELANFDIDAFSIAKMPTVINAPKLSNLNNPYLINKDSLQLKDIVTQLKWSKEFQPIIHLGWRQIGITRKKAIPLKLYAGNNLDYEYQQTLTKKELNQKLNESINVEDEVDLLMNTLSLNNANQQHINYILDNISLITDNDINTIVSDLDSVVLHKSSTNEENPNNANSMFNDPLNIDKPPIQPWGIDGFFKVHLDHYLYITANLSILNTSILEDEDQPKTIKFSQNKRVISGEIHYFDHPYIGMVVQIRRFDPDKPADEAVTQAIK